MRLEQFAPFRDEKDVIIENPNLYAERMQQGPLVNWAKEVLIEWPFRHIDYFGKYKFLEFKKFNFSKELWGLNEIPGREAFESPGFCNNFKDVERRACKRGNEDWLAKYMWEKGTWNTPIILLNNLDSKKSSQSFLNLKCPVHLLEGHRRLSFLNGLREQERAKPKHMVWVVTISK